MVGTTGIELVTPYGYWLPEPPLKISAIFSCSTTHASGHSVRMA